MPTTSADARKAVNDWLARINPKDPGMALDGNGQCRLVSDVEADACTVFVPSGDSPSFYLFQELGRLPPDAGAACEELLAMNLLGAHTRGGTLGFDRKSRQLVFSFSREIVATDVRAFCTALENFLDTATAIRAQVDSLVHAGRQVPTPRRAWRA